MCTLAELEELKQDYNDCEEMLMEIAETNSMLRKTLVTVRAMIYGEHDPDVELPSFIKTTNAVIDKALEGGE